MEGARNQESSAKNEQQGLFVLKRPKVLCVCVCVRACVRACVCVRARSRNMCSPGLEKASKLVGYCLDKFKGVNAARQ